MLASALHSHVIGFTFFCFSPFTEEKSTQASLAHWKRQGWQLKMVNLKNATRYAPW